MKRKRFTQLTVSAIIFLFLFTTAALAADITGMGFSGNFKSSKSGKDWTARMNIGSYDSYSGNFTGQIEWPSLNSVHKIEGQLVGSRFTFKETQAIKRGGAHLNCEYAGIFTQGVVEGNWIDANFDKGTFRIAAKSGGDSIPPQSAAPMDDLTLAQFAGDVKSTKGRSWKANLRFTTYDPNTGNLEGEIEWPSLSSIHKIVGTMNGNRISFKEVSYIKRGSAHLNCSYDARYDRDRISGQWMEPGADRGTFQFNKIR